MSNDLAKRTDPTKPERQKSNDAASRLKHELMADALDRLFGADESIDAPDKSKPPRVILALANHAHTAGWHRAKVLQRGMFKAAAGSGLEMKFAFYGPDDRTGVRRCRITTRWINDPDDMAGVTDPQRFSVAAWLLLEPLYGPHVAARLAIVAIEETTPIEFSTVENLLLVTSAEYLPPRGAAAADFDEQARSLAAKARLVASRANETELNWLVVSSGALRGLIKFMAEGNWSGVVEVQKLLCQAGWADILARLARRLDIPLEAESLRPFDKSRLRAAGRRLLAAMRPEIAPKS